MQVGTLAFQHQHAVGTFAYVSRPLFRTNNAAVVVNVGRVRTNNDKEVTTNDRRSLPLALYEMG